MTLLRRLRALGLGMACAGASLSLSTGEAAAQSAPPCAPPTCVELRKFDVAVADFQTSKQGPTRMVTATIRFRNSGTQPLILGYLSNSGIITDDQGNRYAVYGPVRGMGEITSREFDPKFALEPGTSSEARFEFAWRPSGQEIIGTTYDLDLAVREIDPVASSQYRLGLEHALRFRRLSTELAAGATAAPAAPVAEQKTAALPTVPVDACGATPRCFSAGPFTADIAQLTPSTVGRNHVLQLNVRFRNVSSEPIILGYSVTTSGAIDNYGNRYYWGRPGTHDVSMKGIGKVDSRSADPQFVLQPGQARSATFQVIRYNAGASAIGTEFTYDVALEQLQLLPSQQVRSIRQYSLNFPALTAGTGKTDPLKALKDLLKKN